MNPLKALGEEGLRLFRSGGVGILATSVDFVVLTLLVEGFSLSPAAANFPSLFVGALIQFLGCRHFVFQTSSAALRPQILGFIGVELLALAVNGLIFHILITSVPAHYGTLRILGTFLTFFVFSYPAWHWVFKKTPSNC